MKQVLLVGVGGFAGSVLRYLAYLWIDKRFEGVFPLSTLFVFRSLNPPLQRERC